MACGDFKDVNRRIAADKVFCDKVFHTAKNRKYDANQRIPLKIRNMIYIDVDLFQWSIKVSTKKILVEQLKVK